MNCSRFLQTGAAIDLNVLINPATALHSYTCPDCALRVSLLGYHSHYRDLPVFMLCMFLVYVLVLLGHGWMSSPMSYDSFSIVFLVMSSHQHRYVNKASTIAVKRVHHSRDRWIGQWVESVQAPHSESILFDTCPYVCLGKRTSAVFALDQSKTMLDRSVWSLHSLNVSYWSTPCPLCRAPFEEEAKRATRRNTNNQNQSIRIS